MGYRIKIIIPVKADDSMNETDAKAIELARERFARMGLIVEGEGEVRERLVFTQDEVAVCEHLVEIGK